jgi:hypothetical protein
LKKLMTAECPELTDSTGPGDCVAGASKNPPVQDKFPSTVSDPSASEESPELATLHLQPVADQDFSLIPHSWPSTDPMDESELSRIFHLPAIGKDDAP